MKIRNIEKIRSIARRGNQKYLKLENFKKNQQILNIEKYRNISGKLKKNQIDKDFKNK